MTISTILLIWLLNTAAILITAYLLPGAKVSNFWAGVITALVLGLINSFIRPLLVVFTIPITLLTFGLFIFVINALMIMLTSAIVPGFKVRGFVTALIFSIVLAIINTVFMSLFGLS